MAGLIPQSFIDDLLHRVDIVEVVDKRVGLKRAGKNYQACCPFHNEKTPSFSVQPERQFYYCFGCGAGGNAIGFVMNFDNVDFPQAVETLARDAGVEVPREESKADVRRQSENSKLLEILETASKYYQQQLRAHPRKQAAVDYLKSRGLSGEIARDFALGFAPPGWDNLLNAAGTDEEKTQSLLTAGMIIERNKDKQQDSDSKDDKRAQRPYYDRFRDRIMFPIRDSRGRTVAFGGRVLGDDKPKYLNSPETPVFHKSAELYGLYEARRSGEKFKRLLLVEGYMDVIALAQMGIRNAVATLGTATSARHLQRLFRSVSEVVFCFDGDEAGRTAAWRALETTLPLMEDGRQVRFLFLPEGADPDTFVREHGREGFEKALNEAQPLEDFFFDKLSAELNARSIEGRARLSNLAKPLIRKLPRGIYAQLMLNRLSDTLGVSSESLDELLATEPDPPPPAMEVPPYMDDSTAPNYYPPQEDSSMGQDRGGRTPYPRRAQGSPISRYRKPAALKAIELLLRNPEIALEIQRDLELLRTAEDANRQVLLALIEKVKGNPDIDSAELIGYAFGRIRGQLTELLKDEKITPQEGIEEEFKQIIDNILSDIEKKLHILHLKEKANSAISATKPQNSGGPDAV
jgi:DNA primase